MRRTVTALLVVVVSLGACGDDDDGSASSTTVASAPIETVGTVAPEAPPPGEARLVLGTSIDADLEITSCTVDLDAEPDGQVPATLVAVAASGTDDGREVNLDLRRFRSAGASTTITDTITVAVGDPDAPEQALVAQRFEVDGVASDPRDPEADDPLVRVQSQSGLISARGVFAPPGAFAEDGGLVEGIVDANCP